MRRALIKTAVALAALLLIVAAGAYLYLRRSLPVVNGTVVVSGIAGPVDIVRDADNIPHIFASTRRDALYGLGYVHAQDRLWQMEFQRRIGHGRLSEIFGPVTVPQDRFLRTVGFGRAAHTAWERLPEESRLQIDAYVAGVNAFLAGRTGSRLPPEFTLLRFTPAPWTGPDVIVWIKMMAWDLSANYTFELLRHDLLTRVGPEGTAALLPPYPADGLSILGVVPHAGGDGVGGRAPASEGRLGAARPSDAPSWADAFARGVSRGHPFVRDLLLGGGRTEALGSNNWVVSGARTASGKPMLANDPHLATNIPSLWYLAHLSVGDADVIGATLPGAPAVAIGRNRYIAWGETNVAADVEDFYRERLDPTGTLAEFRGAWEPLRIFDETIAVRDAPPVTVRVRVSRHGPLVSDAINANDEGADAAARRPALDPLAFRWTALDDEDRTVVAFLELNEARNWGEFTAALRHFVVPAQNFVYADVDGHIGYYLSGRIPVRARGDGSAPAEGWTGEMEWTGWIPFDELPHTFDPPDGMIVTANHRPAPPDYEFLIGLEYPDPYRAQRISDLIAGRAKITVDDFRAIQADTLSLHARALLPRLIGHVDPVTAADLEAIMRLKAWDYDARGDSVAATIFQAWFLRLAPALAGDEIGPGALDAYRGRFSHITRFVTQTLSSGESPWCDDVTTTTKETCRQMITSTLQGAVADLTERLGGDMSRWRWDAVHRAVFPHQGLDEVALLRPLLSRSVPNAGDWSTVNVGTTDAARLYQQRSIPGFRQIVDLSAANDSRFADAVGQSGHFLSPSYDDFLKDWRAVAHRPMRMDAAAIEAGALGRLRLTPQ